MHTMYKCLCRFSSWRVLMTVLICAPIIYYLLYNAEGRAKKEKMTLFPRATDSSSTIKSTSDRLRPEPDRLRLEPYQMLATESVEMFPDSVDVLILFTKAKGNEEMRRKLTLCVKSLSERSSIAIKLHVIGDEISRNIARRTISMLRKSKFSSVEYHDVETIANTLHIVVSNMQRHFSYKPGAYYSDIIFFLSLALHQVFTESKMIMLDIDVKVEADVKHLYREFGKFGKDAVIGIAYEQQPVYRHVFQLYRMNLSDPEIGEAPPFGFPGFNSGVLLLNLDKMRNSAAYNQFLNDLVVDELVQKYHFRGHLGDQDFFTLIGIEHRELFYVLSCGWNRQLCQWWRNHGYAEIFDEFYDCKDAVKIVHGNCNTRIR